MVHKNKIVSYFMINYKVCDLEFSKRSPTLTKENKIINELKLSGSSNNKPDVEDFQSRIYINDGSWDRGKFYTFLGMKDCS